MATRPWRREASHRLWLNAHAHELLDFYQQPLRDPRGGYHEMGDDGTPTAEPGRQLVVTSRMVHCFAIAHLLGRPGATPVMDHGLRFLADAHRDSEHGGFRWIVGPDGVGDDSKEAYGHAFVLLAASSALVAGRPGARELLDEASDVLLNRFWSEADGLFAETFSADFAERDTYRGQNSNMHLVEALMAAAEATGDDVYTRHAVRVAERLIRDITAGNGWRIPEHYTEHWTIDADYNADNPEHMYRPFGANPGHWIEWSRLLLQLRALSRPSDDWMLDAAVRLFGQAIEDAWEDEPPGFAYTVDFEGRALNRDRYFWVHAEAVGAAAYLHDATGDDAYEQSYRRSWDFIADHLVDHRHGGWFWLLDPSNRPKHVPGVVVGKPDLYHALQACLFPMVPVESGLVRAIADGKLRLP
jgi:mannose/cellobiose epimerase-like protein (N-acyl-D-glucosamine 2-epimerase family)